MARPDKSDIQWILDALEQDAAKTRGGIGDAIGIDKTGVSRLLSGARALKLRESIEIAAYLGVAPPIGFAEPHAKFDHAPSLVPVYRAKAIAKSEDGSWRLYRNEAPIDRASPPARVAASKDIFGLIAQDGCMAPRFKRGELLIVIPGRKASPGDDVALIARRREAGADRIIIAELVAITPTDFRVFQHKKEGELLLPARSWKVSPVLRG